MASSEPPRSELTPKTVDELFAVLSNEVCRYVVLYFQQASDSTADIDSLVDFCVERAGESIGREQRTIDLHHTALPKLDEIGVLDYDAQSDAVTYYEHPAVELLVSYATQRGESPTPIDDQTQAIRSHLEDAKQTDDEKRKNFHISEALQYLHFEQSVEGRGQ